MSKKLNELFELDESLINPENPLTEPLPDIPTTIPQDALNVLDRINDALPQVRGLEADDNELDELAEMAKEQFAALNDLGMQVDSRFASEIFSVSSTMLGHAITAKTAKLNKKLKMIDLQLKKAALDQKQQQIDEKQAEKDREIDATPLGQGRVMDRNELLRTLMGNQPDNKNTQ
jgi:Zn-finger nucleic acid-binding protein